MAPVKKFLFLFVLSLAPALAMAVPPYPTVWYREKVARHEEVLGGASVVDGVVFLPSGKAFSGLVLTGGVSYADSFWDDITVSALNLFDPPGNAGVAIVSVTTGVYAAEFSVGESGTGIAQTKHSMKAGTALRPHLHVVGNSADPATNVWTLALNSATNSGGTFDRPYAASVTGVVEFAREKMLLLPDYTNYLSESSIFGFVVSNSSGASGFLLDVDFHFEIDKLGSDDADPFA